MARFSSVAISRGGDRRDQEQDLEFTIGKTFVCSQIAGMPKKMQRDLRTEIGWEDLLSAHTARFFAATKPLRRTNDLPVSLDFIEICYIQSIVILRTARTYQMLRRAETAAETRQRMVEATAALHAERGVSATSLRDIAKRAGVSVGTAYHHFPTYDDAIRACAYYNHQIHPLPDSSLFARCTTRAQRIAAFVSAIGSFYGRCPWMEQLRAERSRYAPLHEGLQAFEGAVERLALVALSGPGPAVRSSSRAAGSRSGAAAGNALSTLMALADIAVFRILRERGTPFDAACSTITAAIITSLPGTPRRRVGRGTKQSPRRGTS